jgi:thiamine-phosphate pyrophosphorylase
VYGLGDELRVVVMGEGGDDALLGRFEAAYAAGARAAVWVPTYPVTRDTFRIGREWRRTAERQRVLTFVAERVDVAMAIEADGVYLGSGYPVDMARKVLGRNALVLARLEHAEEARQFARQGADALVLGPLFDAVPGTGDLGLVARTVSIPCLGYGALGPEEARAVAEAGGQGVLVPLGDGVPVAELARVMSGAV